MKTLAISALFIVGATLLLYIFTFGQIWDNHSVQSYLVLCTGIMSVNLGLLALGLTGKQK